MFSGDAGPIPVVPENDSLTDGRWHILVVDEDGVKVKPVKTSRLPAGPGADRLLPDRRSGPSGDRGLRGVLGGRLFGAVSVSVGGPAHARHVGIGSRLSHWRGRTGICGLHRAIRGLFALDAEHGKIELKATLVLPGPGARAHSGRRPIRGYDVSRRGHLGVALLGHGCRNRAIAWKTIVAAPWPTPLAVAAGSPDLVMFGCDGTATCESRPSRSRPGDLSCGIDPAARAISRSRPGSGYDSRLTASRLRDRRRMFERRRSGSRSTTRCGTTWACRQTVRRPDRLWEWRFDTRA